MTTRALADTSIFIAAESGRPLDQALLPDEVAVSVITIGELRAGVLVAHTLEARTARLETLTRALALGPLPIDAAVADQWARLRGILRDEGLRMGVNDSWIAATAMALGIPVLTQDNELPECQGLEVIRV